ncbi:MAG: DUF2971 domain-containing protein [bacterium]
MSLTKLLSLIQTNKMFFSSMNILDDKREGFYRNIDIMGHLDNKEKDIQDFISYDRSTTGHRNYVSCWFKAEYESLAMWDIYGRFNDSIAIQSDLNFFKKCIVDKRDWTLNIGPIKYVNWNSQNLFTPFNEKPNDDELFWYKDKSFQYEHEWRMIITLSEKEFNDMNKPKGLSIEVDTNSLIERIYLSQNYSSWSYDSIKNLLKDYGINSEIRKSRIS